MIINNRCADPEQLLAVVARSLVLMCGQLNPLSSGTTILLCIIAGCLLIKQQQLLAGRSYQESLHMSDGSFQRAASD